jgi:hypothetical protein
MMVQDDEHRWWAKSRETGDWYYYDGSDWARGTPPGYEQIATTTVPDVLGRSLEEVEQALLSAGLILGSSRRQKSRKRAGTVISIDPSAGSEVNVGTSVTPMVSSGPFVFLIAAALVGALALVGLVFAVLLVMNGATTSTPSSPGTTGASPSPSPSPSSSSSSSDEKLRAAVQAYYEAVDREDWDYTYDNLDSQTQQKFTKSEWTQKNQFFASQCPIEQSTPKIGSRISSSQVNVMVNLTFRGCASKSRNTFFVYEDSAWKHRFSDEELNLFLPGTPYGQFVQANS